MYSTCKRCAARYVRENASVCLPCIDAILAESMVDVPTTVPSTVTVEHEDGTVTAWSPEGVTPARVGRHFALMLRALEQCHTVPSACPCAGTGRCLVGVRRH